MTNQNLKAELSQFYGSDTFYYMPPFKKYSYTEGVQYLAEQAEAYWLLEHVFLHQSTSAALFKTEFQVWKITVADDNTAVIRVENGDEEHIKSFQLEFTDFPLKELTLWFINDRLLLPSEY